jgi:ATP-dependent protease ClpP protease subunit
MRKDVVWNLEKHINELKDKKNATLTFYISSHGGDGYLLLDLVELFEQAKQHGIVIRTIVTSHAYSAGYACHSRYYR